MKEYLLNTLSELDEFDDQQAYWDHGVDYFVFVAETQELYSPVYYFRENGDMDGFLGWK